MVTCTFTNKKSINPKLIFNKEIVTLVKEKKKENTLISKLNSLSDERTDMLCN